MKSELRQIHETENFTYVFDAVNGRFIATSKSKNAQALIFDDGTCRREFGHLTADEKAEIKGSLSTLLETVRAEYKAKKAEMFPNFDSLEYHEKQVAQIDARQACGFITASDARYERNGIMAAHGMVVSEEAREQFDNM